MTTLNKLNKLITDYVKVERSPVSYNDIVTGKEYNLYSKVIEKCPYKITVLNKAIDELELQLEEFQVTLGGFKGSYGEAWYLTKT